MSATTKFSQKDFRRGVDDMLTLGPIREAVRQLVRAKRRPNDAGSSGKTASRRSVGLYGEPTSRKTG